MEPTGVRLACPECTWSCVMRSEQDVPEGVNKVIEGVPYCPNCNLPMKPVASVPSVPGERQPPAPPAELSLEERLEKIRAAEREVQDAERSMNSAHEDYKNTKKVFDGKVTTLRTIIARLTTIPAERPPLLVAIDSAATEAVADAGLLDSVVRLCAEEVRLALAKRCIIATVEEIEAWTLEQYDAVASYLSTMEIIDGGGLVDEPRPPEFLSAEVADQVLLLHSRLTSEQRIPVALADVCSLTAEQRARADVWLSGVGGVDRPEFLPAAVNDEPEPPLDDEKPGKRRSRRRQDQPAESEPATA